MKYHWCDYQDTTNEPYIPKLLQTFKNEITLIYGFDNDLLDIFNIIKKKGTKIKDLDNIGDTATAEIYKLEDIQIALINYTSYHEIIIEKQNQQKFETYIKL